MSYLKMKNKIDNKELGTINLLYGEEFYLINEIIKYSKDKCISKGVQDLNYLVLENVKGNTSSIEDFMNTFPFMSEKKILVIEEASFLTSKKVLSEEENKKINEILNNPIETCIVFLVLKNDKPDMRKKIVKTIKTNDSIYEFKKLNEQELFNWIKNAFLKNNININNNNLNYIVENCGYLDYGSSINLFDLKNEIKKLIDFCILKKEVIKKDIEKILIQSTESNIFKLVDLICEEKKKEASIILEDMLLNNTPEQYILHMIVRQYRMILHYILLQKKGFGYNDIMNEMKIKKFVAFKLSNISKKMTLKGVNRYLDKCIDIDRKIKLGEIDKKIGLEILVLQKN